MSKVTALVGLGLFVFCLLTVTAEAIKCFQCISSQDPGCADLKTTDTNSTYYRECEQTLRMGDKKPFCRKAKYTILNGERTVRIVRECGWEIYKTNTTRCYELDTDAKFEVNCQCFHDGCNEAPLALSRPLFPIFLGLAVALGAKLAN